MSMLISRRALGVRENVNSNPLPAPLAVMGPAAGVADQAGAVSSASGRTSGKIDMVSASSISPDDSVSRCLNREESGGGDLLQMYDQLAERGLQPAQVAQLLTAYYAAQERESTVGASESDGSMFSDTSSRAERRRAYWKEVDSKPGEPGYCYLWLVRHTRRARVADLLGDYPTLRQIMSVPPKELAIEDWHNVFVTMGTNGAYHLRRGRDGVTVTNDTPSFWQVVENTRLVLGSIFPPEWRPGRFVLPKGPQLCVMSRFGGSFVQPMNTRESILALEAQSYACTCARDMEDWSRLVERWCPDRVMKMDGEQCAAAWNLTEKQRVLCAADSIEFAPRSVVVADDQASQLADVVVVPDVTYYADAFVVCPGSVVRTLDQVWRESYGSMRLLFFQGQLSRQEVDMVYRCAVDVMYCDYRTAVVMAKEHGFRERVKNAYSRMVDPNNHVIHQSCVYHESRAVTVQDVRPRWDLVSEPGELSLMPEEAVVAVVPVRRARKQAQRSLALLGKHAVKVCVPSELKYEQFERLWVLGPGVISDKHAGVWNDFSAVNRMLKGVPVGITYVCSLGSEDAMVAYVSAMQKGEAICRLDRVPIFDDDRGAVESLLVYREF